jgi:fructose-bisphosphate aldolase, class I
MRRMARIFREDGKTVIIAMDHGLGLDVTAGMKNPGPIIKSIVEGGADAVLTTFGIAARFEQELSGTSLILRMDGGNSKLKPESQAELLYSLEAAVKMGADGVICMGYIGVDQETPSYRNIAYLGEACRDWGIPLIAEMLPGGFGSTPPKTVENVKLAARIGAELGASVIKTTFSGTAEEFQEVIESCFVPVVILGGANSSEVGELYRTIERAISVGTAGVAIGRNVWGKADPGAYTKGLVDIVHGGMPADEVLSRLD